MVLAGCTADTVQAPTDNGIGPETTVSVSQSIGAGLSSVAVASTRADPSLAPIGCPPGTRYSGDETTNLVPNGVQIEVSASDPDGIEEILVIVTALETPSAPVVSNVQVSGLAPGTVLPSSPPGSPLTQIRANFDPLTPSQTITTRSIKFNVIFENGFRIVTATQDVNQSVRSLPLDRAAHSPEQIVFVDVTACR